MSTQTARGAAGRFGPTGLTGRPPRQLWQVPTFFTGLLALVAVAAGTGFRKAPAGGQLQREVAALREALKQPHARAESLAATAQHILECAEQYPERVAEANFLAGLVHARLADQGPPDRAVEERTWAFQHLRQAESHGLDSADRPRLEYYFGKLLYQSGGDLKQAIDYLSRSTAQGAEDPAEGYGLLAEAYLKLPTPDVEAALLANQKELDHGYDDSVLAPAWLQRGELLLRKGLRAEALKVLGHVGPSAPAGVRLKARYLQARCYQEENLFGQAIPRWKEVLVDPSVVPGGKGQVLYALGVCHASGDPRDDAAAVAAWQEAARQENPYGQAAALRLAELRLQGKEAAAALEWFRRALDKVPTAKDYQNPLLSLDQVRELFETGCRVYREAQDHERAQQLADVYKRVALPGVAELRLGEALEARAAALLKKAAGQALPPEAASLREEGVALYRQAATAYEQAAEGRLPLDKAARLWSGANCCLRARDYPRAVALLQQYVKMDLPTDRQAEGWFALAGAYRALKQTDQAKQAYYECVKYPRSAFTYRARLELAMVEIDLQNLKEAEEILKQNLTRTGPPLDRQAEEQSLYKLAELLFQQLKYDSAAFRLKEAVQQFPHNPNALAARDQLGECYRQMADQARVTGTDVPGEKQLIYRSLRQENLEKAYEVYQKLTDDLEAQAALKPLTPAEAELGRKAMLLAVDCLFDMPNNFPEAVRRYTQLAQRFRGRVEGLLACQRLLKCYVYVLPIDSAQAANVLTTVRPFLLAARADLPGMPEETFRAAINRDVPKAAWQSWVEKNIQELEKIPPVPPPSGR